jgi:ubiquinone/menaquinone biosynthesis C-methylase UbiE
MKKTETGARCKRFTKEKALDDYCKEMEVALSEIYRVMKKDSFFCLVFGEIGKKLNGKTVEEKIMEICTQDIKFKLHKTIPRTLTKQRLAARSVEKECIHILQK